MRIEGRKERNKGERRGGRREWLTETSELALIYNASWSQKSLLISTST